MGMGTWNRNRQQQTQISVKDALPISRCSSNSRRNGRGRYFGLWIWNRWEVETCVHVCHTADDLSCPTSLARNITNNFIGSLAVRGCENLSDQVTVAVRCLSSEPLQAYSNNSSLTAIALSHLMSTTKDATLKWPPTDVQHIHHWLAGTPTPALSNPP